MTVAYLTKRRYGSSASLRIVAVYYAVRFGSIEDRRVFLYANDVFEINIKQDVYTGIGHILTPKELTQGGSCTPKLDSIV